MMRKVTRNSLRVRAKNSWNIPDAGLTSGAMDLAGAMIRAALMFAVVLALVPIAAHPAQAQTEQVLYTFTGGSDGGQPYQAGVVFDQSGNLFGVTQYGGTYNQGTVFELTPSPSGPWTETVVYNFTGGEDGGIPLGGLATDGAGDFYGTTAYGGLPDPISCGTLFQINISLHFGVLHTFDDATGDGCQPEFDVNYSSGFITGTTYYGGEREAGTVFFSGPGYYGAFSFPPNFNSNSAEPTGLTLFGSSIYGTANYGGTGGGDVFEFSSPHVIAEHTFTSTGKEGVWPIGALATQVNPDGVRIMYGATQGRGVGGNGAIYQLTAVNGGDTWAISLVHGFFGPDGSLPWAGVVIDSAGNLYGTTWEGGAANLGTVFELTPVAKNTWTYTLLHSFTGANDGANPTGTLVFDSAGNIYGTTFAGGASNQGVVYEVTPPAPTTTTLTSSPNPSIQGRPVTFTAVVSSSAGVPPNGEMVTFRRATESWGVPLNNGSASLTLQTLATGTNTITATYGGDQNFAISTSTVQQVVNPKYATTTVLSSSLNPSNYGQPVTLAATVTTAGPSPTGTVLFRSGSSVLGGGYLYSGVATLTTGKIPVGADTLTASYGGDWFNGISVSAPIPQSVNQASITMTLASSPNPSALGKSVKLTATMTSNGNVPSQQLVTFSCNGTTLGTAKVNREGVATFLTEALPQGSDGVTAEYAGSTDYSSASASVTQVVN